MKKTFNLLSLLLMMVFLYSCEKPILPSNNTENNLQTISNLVINQNISRDSLVRLSMADQIVIINALTPINKRRIYTEKVDILKTEVNFTNAQLEAINRLYSLDLADPYIEDTVDVWRQNVQNSFNWSDSVIFVYFENYYTVSEYLSGYFWSKVSGVEYGGASGVSKPDCICIYNMGCLNGSYCNRERGICYMENRNCGIFGNSWCDGKCE